MATMTDEEIKDVLAEVEKFLKDRRPGVDSGYAPVKDGDVNELGCILQRLIEFKWDSDVDGDYPINWKLIDRTKFEPMYFFEVPYDHYCSTHEQRQRRLDNLITNVNMAVRDLERWSRVRRNERTLERKAESDPDCERHEIMELLQRARGKILFHTENEGGLRIKEITVSELNDGAVVTLTHTEDVEVGDTRARRQHRESDDEQS